MLELLLRTSVILVVAWVMSRLLPRAAAATRHRVWHASILAVVIAPIAMPLLPEIPIASISATAAPLRKSIARFAMNDESIRGRTSEEVAAPAPDRSSKPATLIWQAAAPPAQWVATMLALGPLVWMAGSVTLAIWFLSGWLMSARRARRAARAPAGWQQQVSDLRVDLGIRRSVAVRVLSRNGSPMVVGLWHSTILLPPIAGVWSDERRRAVLLHELAHVQRGDCRVQALSQAACAMYWFNPLVWMAATALRTERERACDDEVLRAGAQPAAYAEHLLEIARDLSSTMRPSAALAMARPAELEGRLLAVLADGRPRTGGAVSRWLIPLLIVSTTGLALGASPVDDGTTASVTPATSVVSPTGFDGHSPESRDADRQAQSQAIAALTAAADPDERSRAALNLATTGAVDVIPSLGGALRDESEDVREKAALALGLQPGVGVVPYLIEALRDPSAQVREKAALGLALRRDQRSVQALIAAAADPDAQVREKVALALGTSGDARSMPAIEALLDDPDAQVREKATIAVSLISSAGPDDAAGERARAGLRSIMKGLLALIE